MGRTVSSAIILQHLKHEEVEMKITPSIVSINALATKRGMTACNVGDSIVPSLYAAGSSNQNGHENEKVNQQQNKQPVPYDHQQCSVPWKICENMYCETSVWYSKADCFSYGGGKAGKYPENFHGKKDIHLAPEARIAARRIQGS